MFEKAVALSPDEEWFTGNLADGYRWSGQKEKSLATYHKAIAMAYKELQVNPRDASVMGRLASYYAKEDDRAQALEWMSRARTLDTNSIQLMSQAAIVHTLASRPEEALADLREAFRKATPPRRRAENQNSEASRAVLNLLICWRNSVLTRSEPAIPS
jgi:tetratricopeptide (TPR) repeat protein